MLESVSFRNLFGSVPRVDATSCRNGGANFTEREAVREDVAIGRFVLHGPSNVGSDVMMSAGFFSRLSLAAATTWRSWIGMIVAHAYIARMRS